MADLAYDSRYDSARIMGIVDGTSGADQLARPGQRVLIVDALSQDWQELLNGIGAWREEVWRGEKITSTCYRHHGVSNTWQIVLSFNGLGTPTELRPGMLLRVPLKSEIDRLLQRAVPGTSNAGKTITI